MVSVGTREGWVNALNRLVVEGKAEGQAGRGSSPLQGGDCW